MSGTVFCSQSLISAHFMAFSFCRIQEELISALWGYTGRALKEDKDFFQGSWRPNSLCRATCNPMNTLLLAPSHTWPSPVLRQVFHGLSMLPTALSEASFSSFGCTCKAKAEDESRLNKWEAEIPGPFPAGPNILCSAEHPEDFSALYAKLNVVKSWMPRSFLVRLSKEGEKEKNYKNWIGDLQSWACCSFSHGKDVIWEQEWLSTDVRVALSLFFPASFVSPHGPALFLEPRDLFPAVEHQEPFPWRGKLGKSASLG